MGMVNDDFYYPTLKEEEGGVRGQDSSKHCTSVK